MLPWVYEFRWDAGHIIFLGVFFSVLIIIASTLMRALMRAIGDFKNRRVDHVMWEVAFEDLPEPARACRHQLSGEVAHRTCPNEFDCRDCVSHELFLRANPVPPAGTGPQAPEEEQLFGLSFPLDRYYDRGHTWVKPAADGTLLVGLNDLGTRLLGSVENIQLPEIGSTMHVHGTAWQVSTRGADTRILSPVEGTVVDVGGPGKEWYLKVRPEGNGDALRHLLRGAEIKPWLTRELERLQFALSEDGVGMSLADGGVPVEDLPRSAPKADWDAVWGEMFLEA
jgi:glycine cleavage system H lipoate-binding protein